MDRNILLRLQYDGSNFHGWQVQPGVRTAQGVLEEALSVLCGEKINVNGSSRTDAGVHALDQCCTFKLPTSIPTSRIPRALNGILSETRRPAGHKIGDLCVKSAEEVSPDFHARFDCKGKTYVYLINTGKPDVFMRNYSYRVEGVPDWEAMNKAASLIRGKHDFSSFRTVGDEAVGSAVRTIFSCKVFKLFGRDIKSDILFDDSTRINYSFSKEKDALRTYQDSFDRYDGRDLIAISVTGDGFLYNMVRIITGTLLEIGMAKRNPDDINHILLAKDRRAAGHTAPPEGLFLKRVYFDSREIPSAF